MWKVLELIAASGKWKELGSFSDVDEAKKKLTSNNVYAFWDGPMPSDKDAQTQKALEVISLNGDRILRATIGVKFGLIQNDNSISSCPGNCFCVVAHGKRQCETSYCNENGYCWWVPCGMGC